MPTGGLDVAAGSFLAGAFGETAAAALGSAALGAEIGAGVGGVSSAIRGGNPLTGALKGGVSGGLTGGALGFGPSIGSALGVGEVAGDALAGAGGGAIGSALTGGNALTGALEGGLAGGAKGFFAPTTGPGTGNAGTSPLPSTTSAGAGVGGTLPGAGAVSGSGIPGLDSSDVTLGTVDLPKGVSSLGTADTAYGGANIGTQGISGTNAGTYFGNNTGGVSPSLASAAGEANKSFFNKALTGVEDNFTKNPAGIAISAGGIGLDLLKGNKQSGAEKNLKAQAGRLDAQGQAMQQYLQTGTLPPGLQASVNQATESAKATIRSRFASHGMSGSSAEQQELAAADARGQSEGAQLGLQLLSTGIQESGMASQLYQVILGEQIQQDNELGAAIGRFAGAAGGGNPLTNSATG